MAGVTPAGAASAGAGRRLRASSRFVLLFFLRRCSRQPSGCRPLRRLGSWGEDRSDALTPLLPSSTAELLRTRGVRKSRSFVRVHCDLRLFPLQLRPGPADGCEVTGCFPGGYAELHLRPQHRRCLPCCTLTRLEWYLSYFKKLISLKGERNLISISISSISREVEHLRNVHPLFSFR